MPTLHVLQGPDKGRTYEALNEPAVIGRSSEQVHLTDNGTSRRHAELRPKDGRWFLCDLNSSNGTFLNGQRVLSPTEVKHGDQIKVGSTLLVFGGDQQAQRFGPPTTIRDLVDLDNPSGGSAILAAIDSAAESVILQPPETADAVSAWNVVYKIAESIGTIESVEAFLERVTDIMFDHLIVDRLVLLMRGNDEEDMQPQLIRQRSAAGNGRHPIVTSQTIISHVLKTQEGVLCANAMTDDRFRGENSHDSIHRLGLQSVICVPILAHNVVHGVFHLDCSMSHHTYTPEQLRLVVAIGRLTGLAIENAKLQESRVRTERLAAAGEAVAYLSHYIRNLLQGMQGGADVVELALKKRCLETAASGWKLVRHNLDRSYCLMLNMLTFSKERQPRVEPTRINGIVEDVVALTQTRADEKSVMILADFEAIPPVPVDPDGIHQVIHNIVLNALDAVARNDGRINIKTSYDAKTGEVVIAVTDNGPGIPQTELPSIFDAFQSSKGHGGTGLGLAASWKIVDELGGRIDVKSREGEGATFYVRLPLQTVTLTKDGAADPAR